MAKTVKKLKIKTNGKSYSYKDSPLYGIRTKKKLAKILGQSLTVIKGLEGDNGYHCFVDNGRDIQEPVGSLMLVHNRFASLLSRIAMPDFLHSGIKGRSHISNADKHTGFKPLLTTDLKAFFQTTSRLSVFGFFYGRMNCAPDVADLIANLCTYGGHIPTGSQLSMPLAFFANSKMFHDMAKMSDKHNADMTVYVDDLTFSGPSVNKRFLHHIKRIAKDFGHTIHPKKTKLYGSGKAKEVTGTIVFKDKLLVRNIDHKKMFDLQHSLVNCTNKNKRSTFRKKLVGKLNSMGAIDSKYSEKSKLLPQ